MITYLYSYHYVKKCFLYYTYNEFENHEESTGTNVSGTLTHWPLGDFNEILNM